MATSFKYSNILNCCLKADLSQIHSISFNPPETNKQNVSNCILLKSVAQVKKTCFEKPESEVYSILFSTNMRKTK